MSQLILMPQLLSPLTSSANMPAVSEANLLNEMHHFSLINCLFSLLKYAFPFKPDKNLSTLRLKGILNGFSFQKVQTNTVMCSAARVLQFLQYWTKTNECCFSAAALIIKSFA